MKLAEDLIEPVFVGGKDILSHQAHIRQPFFV